MDVGDDLSAFVGHKPLALFLVRVEEVFGEDSRAPGLVDYRKVGFVVRTCVSISLDLPVPARELIRLELFLGDFVQDLALLVALGDTDSRPY